MVVGELEATGGDVGIGVPSLVLRSGTPTSLNPVKAVLQGMRGDLEYKERTWPVRVRACTGCGVVEFCLSPGDTQQLRDLPEV
jgi:hypothetical protein